MIFTDAELNKLKSQLETSIYSIGPKIVKALIERLEAAEYALLRFQIVPPSERTSGMEEALDLWKKTAGK